MGRAKLAWSAFRLVAVTAATVFLVHSYTVHRSEAGSFRNTPLVIGVALWLLVGTLSIDSAPTAGPGAREFFFAAVSMLAGLAAAGAVMFDVDAPAHGAHLRAMWKAAGQRLRLPGLRSRSPIARITMRGT